jgi:hypothetical protein
LIKPIVIHSTSASEDFMGLDWVPLPKPKPGYEVEFEELFLQVFKGKKPPALDPKWKTLLGLSRPPSIESLQEKFFDIPSISPSETLDAPRIGHSAAADQWVRDSYEKGELRKDLLAMPTEQVLKELSGGYLPEVMPLCDGIPVYISGPGYDAEASWFRGKFLEFCEDVLDKKTFSDAWEHKLPREILEYGHRLKSIAETYAREKGVEKVLPIFKYDWDDEDSSEAKAHILISAARWCLYWGERGHGMQAYF